MSQAPTYYELLQISSGASAEQVRSAYLRLVKRYHPDVADQSAASADILPLINHVYRALSDPVRRAAYDAQLARQVSPRFALARKQPFAAAPNAGRTLALLAASAIALGVAATLLVPAVDSSPDQGESILPALNWLLPQPLPTEKPAALRLPPAADVRREARLGASLQPIEAAARSTACFAASRARASRDAVQLCIIFDDAFLYAHKFPASALPAYFQDVIVEVRHASALGVATDDPVLDRLWRASFAALLAIYSPSAEPLDTTSAQAATAHSGVKSQGNESGIQVEPPHLPQGGTSGHR